jgi:hypothetical protein
MAGKRQHYVPRLLQRGFLLHSMDDSDAERTWLHRRGVAPRPVSINDIGVEEWFYSRKSADGSPTLDDHITDLEDELGPTVASFREAQPRTIIDAAEAAACVVHLVMRTKHLRSMLDDGMNTIINDVGALFSDPGRLGQIFGFVGQELSPSITNGIRNAALDLAGQGVPPSLSERLMTILVRENQDLIVANVTSDMAPILGLLGAGINLKVRDAHNRILTHAPEENAWLSRLTSFRWTIEEGEGLILPDAVALAVEADARLVPLLFATGPDTTGVAMPVAHNRILVGLAPERETLPIAQFNEQAAAACSAFFISSLPLEDTGLADRIGRGPADAIQSAIDEAVREFEPVHPHQFEQSNVRIENTFEQRGFSYSVSLPDWGDAAVARELGQAIHSIVGEIARHLPLQELDGFTIAADYREALAELDRGDPTLPAVESTALDYGTGAAMPVTVIRDGQAKEHFVVNAAIAVCLLSDDEQLRASAIAFFVKLLANVGHGTLFARDAAFTFKPDALTRDLHLLVASTPCGWFTAREAAFIAPFVGKEYADLVIQSLEFAEGELALEAVKAREAGDISNFTRRAGECVAATLSHAADWLGHRAGLVEGQLFDGDDLPAQLRSRGLDHWIELFGRDLAAVYANPAAGMDLAVVTRLSQHVERLLWSLGVYAWSEEEGIQCLVTDQPFRPGEMFPSAGSDLLLEPMDSEM